jgi:hypothetical protein
VTAAAVHGPVRGHQQKFCSQDMPAGQGTSAVHSSTQALPLPASTGQQLGRAELPAAIPKQSQSDVQLSSVHTPRVGFMVSSTRHEGISGPV